MAYINHVNLATPNSGTVYCRKRNRVVKLDENQLDNHCASCDMYRGSAQGEGVECYWNDKRKGLSDPHVAIEPNKEYDQVAIADLKVQDKKLVVKDK